MPLQRRPLRDASTKNTFTKFQATIDKRFEKQLADFDEEEFRQLEYLKDLFTFLDEITPDSDWDEAEVPVKKRGGNKRCALSDLLFWMYPADDYLQTIGERCL